MSVISHNPLETLNHQRETTVGDYFSLLKPRVMSLVVFSAITGLIIAPGTIHPFIAAIAILCTAIGAGAAGALNMWYDRDIDIIMTRTKNRPTATGVIPEYEALAFGIILSVTSVILMWICVNTVAAVLLLASILFYFFIYTVWLKRSSIQNIVIGGAAGAFPPMIGWAAVTGNIEFNSLILFLIIFVWTPPHFWALALYKSDDYKSANIPMMPVVKGANYTKKQILLYSVILGVSSLLPAFIKMAGKFYLVSAVILSAYFLYLAVRLYKEQDNKLAPRLFGFSIIYLFALFSALIIDYYL